MEHRKRKHNITLELAELRSKNRSKVERQKQMHRGHEKASLVADSQVHHLLHQMIETQKRMLQHQIAHLSDQLTSIERQIGDNSRPESRENVMIASTDSEEQPGHNDFILESTDPLIDAVDKSGDILPSLNSNDDILLGAIIADGVSEEFETTNHSFLGAIPADYRTDILFEEVSEESIERHAHHESPKSTDQLSGGPSIFDNAELGVPDSRSVCTRFEAETSPSQSAALQPDEQDCSTEDQVFCQTSAQRQPSACVSDIAESVCDMVDLLHDMPDERHGDRVWKGQEQRSAPYYETRLCALLALER